MPDFFAQLVDPIGTISSWSGTLANIPYGWALCDGSTLYGVTLPDLHAKFLRGAPAGNEAGTTGGEDTHVLTTSEIPSHNHSFSNTAHSHTAPFSERSNTSDSTHPRDSNNFSMNTNTSGLTINNAGSGTAHENRPAFFELAYIMKVF